MSNVGKWSNYTGERLDYGTPYVYDLIGALTAGCALVEDWGCGFATLADHLAPGSLYRGIDGSSPHADEIVDLCEYRSLANAVILRGVLEHNDGWAQILDNAVASFTERLVIALFTPMVDESELLFREPEFGDVPVIAFALGDLLAHLPLSRLWFTLPSPDTAYRAETIILAWR